MSPGDVLSIPPQDIRFKLSNDLDLGGIRDGDWDIARRIPIEETDKHRSVFQRYVDGLPWLDTDLFKGRYADYLRKGERARGAKTLEDAARRYEREVDSVFADIKTNGFRSNVVLPKVHVGRDGSILLGNNGNHRLAMAKVLDLPEIKVKVYTIHAAYRA